MALYVAKNMEKLKREIIITINGEKDSPKSKHMPLYGHKR